MSVGRMKRGGGHWGHTVGSRLSAVQEWHHLLPVGGAPPS